MSQVLLEQTTPGIFVRHVLEAGTCDHLACATGDLDNDSLPDLAVGDYVRSGKPAAGLMLWRNALKR